MTRQSLLLVFEESILPTHRSKFVQFVLFFASGRAHGLGYALTSKLIDVLRDDMKPKVGCVSKMPENRIDVTRHEKAKEFNLACYCVDKRGS